MGIAKNFFKTAFSKLSVNKKSNKDANTMSIQLDLSRFGRKLDYAQDALDSQIWQDIQKYMPLDKGDLIAQTDILNKSTRGEVYLYPPSSDYGHYQYEGIKYIDPVYKVGAFYSEKYGFWSRPGIKKIPSNEFLFYQRDTAEAHWDERAYADNKDKWLQVARRAVR